MRKNTSKDSSPLGGIRILLAEDALDNQRLILHVLRKAGADVKIAANEKLAIEMLAIDGTLESPLLEPCRFDLLLSDMQMPEMDGYAATRWLRARGCALPIVALTAHARREDLERYLEAGCNAYTTKPINKAILIDLYWKWAIESRPTVAGKS